MNDLADIFQRGHLPLFALSLAIGLGLAAASRDLGKRLFGACIAAIAGIVELSVLTRDDPALESGIVAASVVVFASAMLGLALLVRIRESFGGVDAGGLRLAEAADDRAERGE